MNDDYKPDPQTEEISELVRQLSDVERRLQTLTEGQVDAVVDPDSGTPIILRHAQAELRRSKARLRLVLDHLPAVVWTTDQDLNVTSLSGAVLSQVGVERAQVVGRPLPDLDNLIDLTDVLPAHREALRGESTTFEARVGQRTFDATVEPLHDAVGEIAGCVGMAVDVTTRVELERGLRESRAEMEQRVEERTAELSEAYEELQVTEEEIRQQNDELRAARRDLEAERRRYQELFTLAPDGYVVTDGKGTIEEANAAASHLLGVPGEFLVGKPLTIFVAPGARGPFYSLMSRAEEAGRGRRFEAELDLSPRDGRPFPASVSVTATDDGADGMGLRWMLRDISETRRLMKENRRQRVFLEQLMDVAPVGIALVRGDDHVFEIANAYYRAIPGAQRPVVGRPFAEVFPAAGETTLKLLDQVYRTAQAEQLRERKGLFVPGEGQTYWNVDLVPLQDLDDAVNSVLILTRDVSREVRARKEIERLAVRTQQQADQLDAVFNAMSDAVIVYDDQGLPVEANRAAVEAYGLNPVGAAREELIEKLAIRTPERQPVSLESLPSSRALRGETVEGAHYIFSNADDRELMIVASAAPLRSNGEVSGAVVVWHDVTEREMLLAEVNAQRERAQSLAADLQRERDKLQTIMENTHAQLAYLDADFTFVHVNTAYAQGAGYTPDDLIGENHFDLFPDPENEVVFQEVLETGEPVFFRGRPFVYADQPERGVTYWDWSLVPVKNVDGAVRGLVFSLLNVTERERLLRQLDAEQSRLDAIIQNSPEGIVVVDEKARITLTNPAAERLYGRAIPHGETYESHAELCICRPDGTAIPPRELPLTRSALDGETHHDEELSIVWPGGEQRDLLVDTAPIRGSDGQLTGAVGIFRDITQRKEIERAVWQYAERLRALHELDQAILTADSAQEIAEAALTRLRSLVRCRRASVEVFDFEADEALLLAVDADDATGLHTGRRVPLTWHRSLEDLREGRAYVDEDLETAASDPVRETLRDAGVRSFASVPLRARGELIGALNVGLRTRGGPSQDQMGVIESLAGQLAIGIRQARLYQEVQAYAEELEARVKSRTAQLRASEARFRAIFEQSAAGIALLDRKGRVMVSNAALHDMLEREPEELQGQAFTDFAHPDEELRKDIAAYRQLRSGERDNYRLQTRYLTRSGEVGWANMVLSLVRGPEGQPQFIIAIVEDITERKVAREALRKSQQRQSVALQAVGGGIYDYPIPLDETTYHSEAWAQVLGYGQEELPPYDAFKEWIYERVHPDDRAYMEETYEDFVAGRSGRFHLEIRMHHRRGHWIWVEALADASERDEDGRATHVVGIMRDISERKQAHQALVQSEKLATTGRLAASLAHEINNPLQTVVGCLGLAEESMQASGDGDEEVEAYVSMAHDELQRAARIVSRLRDLSRPTDPGRGRPTDVNELIDSVLQVSRKDLKNHQIQVVRHLDQELPRPVVVADRIKQVILNLVLNARDAMESGGELHVTTAYDEGNDEVVISIADQGPGISEEMRDRLFDPFFSTKDDGSGLGLFVSQNIVREHGGRIEVSSVVGEGATFHIHLPVSQD